MSFRRKRRHDRDALFSGDTPDRAIIDIGSNTVRTVVYGGSPRAPSVLFNEKVAAKLGREIDETGRLADEAVEIALRELARAAMILRELGIDDVEAVATAAVREASNGPEFLDAVRALGFDPRVVSGEEEARISAMGVIGAFHHAQGVVADLGGGSLELVAIDDDTPARATSLPLGTLRLADLRENGLDAMRRTLGERLEEAGWAKPINGALYLVGGTWRAMAVLATDRQEYPLSDPHGFSLEAAKAETLAARIEGMDSASLAANPRISSLRASTLPDAGVLLQALIEALQPERIVFSSWGLREGLLFDRLEPWARRQDPLIAAVSAFGSLRGVPHTLAARVASWTVDAIPPLARGEERLRHAATTLALASMQIEPNLRIHQAMDWALHKRWVGVDGRGRAMMAAAISANKNACDLPESLHALAPCEDLEQAICWGLAIRLCRRLGARARIAFENARLRLENGKLQLTLDPSIAALYGLSTEKDLAILAARLDAEAVCAIAPIERLSD